MVVVFFFFQVTATPEFYTYGLTLSLHYALPICGRRGLGPRLLPADLVTGGPAVGDGEQPGEQRDRQQHEEDLVPAALMGEHRGDHRAARASGRVRTAPGSQVGVADRKSTRLHSSH